MPSSDPSAAGKAPVSLEFSEKYDSAHAEHYLRQYRLTMGSRLSNWREIGMARKALRMAGDPAQVLDLPCGAGRFWSMLAERAGRTIIGADNSADMVSIATRAQPPAVVARVKAMQTSAFAIELPDAVVDCVFCMRLLHHIGEAPHRMIILKEFHRVTRDTVVLSLWVDGNFKAWRRRRSEAKRAAGDEKKARNNRFLLSRSVVEAEFKESGFNIVGAIDFLPGISMWRTYILKKRA
jgi:ubiquinone/menaquinone biosynthesis C-methylase UbiE